MGQYIKVKGYSITLSTNKEYAYEIYEKLNLMTFIEFDDDEYIGENFDILHEWTPYLDENGTYGLIYPALYEWDAQPEEMFYSDTEIDPPLDILPKPKLFYMYYYNASESPFNFK